MFLPVSALGIWLFIGFLRLPDWTLAPEAPVGLKVLGQLGRVLGSLAAAACIGLEAPDFQASRPALAATFLLGFLGSLFVRLLGSAVAEMRRWARLGSLIVLGAAVALLTVALVLNLTQWKLVMLTAPLAVFDGVSAVLFMFLLVYFALPRIADAFEAHGL